MYEFISFSKPAWKTDGLRSPLPKESYPYRSKWDVSSTIQPMVIASMDRERAAGEVEAQLLGRLVQVHVLHCRSVSMQA